MLRSLLVRTSRTLPAVLSGCLIFTCALAVQAAPREGVAIRLNDRGQVEIAPITDAASQLGGESRGLIVWADPEGDRWQPIGTADRGAGALVRLAEAARATGEAGTPDPTAATLTAYLDPLTDPEVTRGEGLLTPPPQGWVLGPAVTFRRRPEEGTERYPARRLTLSSGSMTAEIPFPAGRDKLAFDDYRESLPSEWKEGLPPGEYEARIEGTSTASAFFVEETAFRDAVRSPLERLAAVSPARTDPLFRQLAGERYLSAVEGRSYLSDALDVLDVVEGDAFLTPFLLRRKQDVLWRLGEGDAPPAAAEADRVGIAEIDAARDAIAGGRWGEALAGLDAAAEEPDDRTRALARLYRGVVLAEAALGEEYDASGGGQATRADADAEFRAAIELLKGASDEDRHRAHNNYANFLLRRAQDRLHNHAFQMASGVRHPIVQALVALYAARVHYEEALRLAASDEARAAVQVNMARLHALTADVIRTLDAASDDRLFEEGEQAAIAAARGAADAAAELAEKGGTSGALTRGVALEMRAHLEYRSGEFDGCLETAGKAREAYAAAGSLAGMESVHRLLGQARLHGQPAAAVASADRQAALADFTISQIVAETLRERFPSDRVGLSRAGFFSRRAYVVEQIAELLIAEGRAAEALAVLESAKARSLRDLLEAQQRESEGVSTDEAEPENAGATESSSEFLEDWPANVAAVEYFLGSRTGYVFVVDTAGEVGVYPIADPDGRPLESRELIARVRTFLTGIGGQAKKMRSRLLSGRGYDHAWQDDLDRFRHELLPDAALAKLRNADTVVVVPHHILHYFPFAALVTEPDRRERDASEMVVPRFLIDEPFTLCNAPSLGVWRRLRADDEPLSKASAVGIVDFERAPSLPGVQKDVDNLKAAFDGRVAAVRFAGEADEGSVKALLAEPGLLLFATHGMNVADHPLASHLLLHPRAGEGGEAEDGSLTAAEIFERELGADYVVMSACYSGLADRSPMPGDDLFGLQRAFLQSGARTVVSGLWDVYDGTGPELIKGLFDRLAAGEPAARALAGSQRAFLKQLREADEPDPWLHPHFWAVYTTSGSDLTRFSPAGE